MGARKGGSNDARDEEVGCPITRIGVQLSRLNATFDSHVPIEAGLVPSSYERGTP